jgi:hypothetical protein
LKHRKWVNISQYGPISDVSTPGLWRSRKAKFSSSFGINR